MNVCVDVEWGADARGHAKDLWPFITRLDLIHRTADHSSPDRLIFNLGPVPDPVPDLDRVRTFGTGTL